MKVYVKTLVILGLLVGVGALVGGISCTSLAKEPEYTFYFVSHGGPADPFWGHVIKGMNDAARRFPEVSVKYYGPEKFSLTKLVDMLNAAIAAKPDGLAVTLTVPEALKEPLMRAHEEGIPVVAINVWPTEETRKEIPFLLYIGQNEYLGGKILARKLLEEGTPKRAVCGNHEIGHVGLEARCQGFMEVMKQAGIPVDELNTTTEMAAGVDAFRSYLNKHPETDCFMGAGGLSGDQLAMFLREEGLDKGRVLAGCFDMSPTILEAVEDGTFIATINQQQYLQGYLPVVILYLHKKYHFTPTGDILTGPYVIDKNNIGVIEELIEQGIWG